MFPPGKPVPTAPRAPVLPQGRAEAQPSFPLRTGGPNKAMNIGARASILPIMKDISTPPEPRLPTPDEIRARVLHDDGEVVVIDKPAGLAVHAAGRITTHLEQILPVLADTLGNPPRLAHRLDRDTAGCLVLGRTDWALKRMGGLFARAQVEKTYWAVTEGRPPEDSGVIDLPLLKVFEPGKWNIVPHPDGRPAVTEWTVLGRDGNGRAWLELRPRTGRTHQIRVHLAAIGCPILGEPYYGPERRMPGAPHLLARRVVFRLGPTREEIDATAPPPDHMAEALVACGFVR